MSTTPEGKPAAQAYKATSEEVVQFLQERAVLGETRRYKELDRREAHYRCKQYDHQKLDWWGRSAELTETISPDSVMPMGFVQLGGGIPQGVTVRDKRPTAPAQLAKQIIDRFTEMVLSDERKPKITIEGDEDTTALLDSIQEESQFWSAMRGARDKGGSVGSVLVTVHLREGQFAYEVHNTKDCGTIIWKDKRSWKPQGILKMYRYPVDEDVVDEKTGELVGTREVMYLYRRIITDNVDIVFKPVKVEPNEAYVEWEADPALTVEHNLGFFPGVWVQNKQDSDSMDGDADPEGAWQACDSADRMLAQMNYGVLHNLDPTPVIKADPKEVALGGGLRKGSDNAIYPGLNGDAKYMEMTGSSIDAAEKLYRIFKGEALNIARCVLVDPEKISGAAQSAKAIEYIYAPMLGRCGELRTQYGNAMKELMKLTEKICRTFMGRSVLLENGSIGVFKLNLPPKTRDVDLPDGTKRTIAEDHKLGPGGHYKIVWGPYFAPTKQDDQLEIANATAANQGGLIDKEAAARKVAPIFGITDVEGTVKKAAAELEADASSRMMIPGGGFDGGVPHAPPPPGQGPPRPNPNHDAGTPPGGNGGKP